MPWYIWFLIDFWGGATVGLFLACLLHCSKEADERKALLMWVAEWGVRNVELQEHATKHGLKEVGI